jgi:hypothetical protein
VVSFEDETNRDPETYRKALLDAFSRTSHSSTRRVTSTPGRTSCRTSSVRSSAWRWPQRAGPPKRGSIWYSSPSTRKQT